MLRLLVLEVQIGCRTMILQIVEIAFGSLTAITCSGLAFVSAWDGRRMRAMQREVDAMDAEEKAAKDLIASKELAEKVERGARGK